MEILSNSIYNSCSDGLCATFGRIVYPHPNTDSEIHLVCTCKLLQHVWRSEDSSQDRSVSFHHESPRHLTQSLSLAAKHLFTCWAISPFGWFRLDINNCIFVIGILSCWTFVLCILFPEHDMNSQDRGCLSPVPYPLLASLFVRRCLGVLSMQKWWPWSLPRGLV